MIELRELRQGDFSFDENWFVYRSAPDHGGNSVVEEEIVGIVILSQSCDIVRDASERPYLEVCPLVQIKQDSILNEIQKGLRPRYAYVPQAAEQMLVADLDRVMTVDKAHASSWKFQKGCINGQEQRHFASALARKRTRFALPDDIVQRLRPLQTRILKKHPRDSPEGRLLRLMKEIRLLAFPSWESSRTVTLYFFFPEEIEIAPEAENQCALWIDSLGETAGNPTFEGIATHYSALSAWEYRMSVPLDLDHLSG